MADTKITALAAITTVDPAADVLPIVDISDTSMAASGTTKKITTNQILQAGGTATLASATITGDLTVDTNTFYVNSAANRVLIGTLSALGSATLSIAGKTQADTAVAGDVIGNFNNTSATGFGFRIGGGSATGGYALSVNNNTGSEFHQISGTGIATWSNVGGVAGTAMTLNSTGLGVGVTPSAWNTAYKAIELGSNVGSFSATTGIFDSALNAFFNTSSQWIYKTTAAATIYRQQAGEHRWFNAASGTAGTAVTFTQAMTLDASGRLLVGGTTGFSIPNGAGTAFTPSVQSITTSGSSAVCAVVSDGTNNRRIGLFVDNDNGINGISANKTTTSVPFVYRDSGNERLRIDTSGNLISTVPATPPTLAANSQMVFNLTSDTNLRISVRGTDGTTRTANITLA
jgi:hypothetical protein